VQQQQLEGKTIRRESESESESEREEQEER
jgi:hypothetical protein